MFLFPLPLLCLASLLEASSLWIPRESPPEIKGDLQTFMLGTEHTESKGPLSVIPHVQAVTEMRDRYPSLDAERFQIKAAPLGSESTDTGNEIGPPPQPNLPSFRLARLRLKILEVDGNGAIAQNLPESREHTSWSKTVYIRPFQTPVAAGDIFEVNAWPSGHRKRHRGTLREHPIHSLHLLHPPRKIASGITANPELQRIARALKPVLEQLKAVVEINYPEETPSLIVSYKTEIYLVSRKNKDGGRQALRREAGPTEDGFLLKINLIDKNEPTALGLRSTITEDLWKTDLGVLELAGTFHKITWSLSYQTKTDQAFLESLRHTLENLRDRK